MSVNFNPSARPGLFLQRNGIFVKQYLSEICD